MKLMMHFKCYWYVLKTSKIDHSALNLIEQSIAMILPELINLTFDFVHFNFGGLCPYLIRLYKVYKSINIIIINLVVYI